MAAGRKPPAAVFNTRIKTMPNYEYEPIADNSISPNAVIIINSIQFDATEGDDSLFDDFFETLAVENELSEPQKEVNEESYEMTSEGEISLSNGRVDIRYPEGSESLPPWITSVSFDKNEKGIISIIRYGQMSHSFVIQQGVRHYSVYTTPYGPLEMCIRGIKVINEMTEEGGKLTLDYAVELKGMTAQRKKMTVKVKKR